MLRRRSEQSERPDGVNAEQRHEVRGVLERAAMRMSWSSLTAGYEVEPSFAVRHLRLVSRSLAIPAARMAPNTVRARFASVGDPVDSGLLPGARIVHAGVANLGTAVALISDADERADVLVIRAWVLEGLISLKTAQKALAKISEYLGLGEDFRSA